jgi:hypothetical protein
MMGNANAVRVGNANRAEEGATVANPVRTGHFAIAVERVTAGKHGHRLRCVTPRQNRGDTGAHRTLADDQRAFTGLQRGISDLHAGYIRYRIIRPGRSRVIEPEIAGTYGFGGICHIGYLNSRCKEDQVLWRFSPVYPIRPSISITR